MAVNAFNKNLVGFRQKLGDFSRNYMFRISVPAWYGGDTGIETLSMMARSVSLPAYKIKTTQIGFQGMKMNVATVPEFDPNFTVEILADEKQVLRGNIMKWMSYIYDPATMEASTLDGDNGYKRDNVVVQQLDRAGQTIMAYQFYGLFPSSCDSIKLSHDEVDPQKFSVTFAYDFFTFNLQAPGTLTSGEGTTDIKGDNAKAGFRIGSDGKAGAGDTEPTQSANKPPLE